MASAKPKVQPKEIDLGSDFGPVNVSVNGVLLKSGGKDGLTVLKAEKDVVVFTKGNVMAQGGHVVAHPTEEEESEASTEIEETSIDEYTVKVGDVLGFSGKLRPSLDHLRGWIVYNITDEGVPQVLEPIQSAPTEPVSLKAAFKHVASLNKQGHNARMWNSSDGNAVMKAVALNNDFNAKAQLEIRWLKRAGYWGDALSAPTVYACEMKDYSDNMTGKYFVYSEHPKTKNLNRVRAVQDVPQLAPGNDF